ncbi:DNA-processing protein DprA, partial [Mitsuokella multacida]
MDARQDFYLAALAQCPGLGSRRLGLLLETGRDAVSLWQMPALEMSRLVRMPQGLVEALQSFRRTHPDLPELLAESCQQRGVHLCTIRDASYPYLLKEIFSAPPVLYFRGTLVPEARRLAIVGSRRLSPYGEALALEFGEQLAAAGLTVV